MSSSEQKQPPGERQLKRYGTHGNGSPDQLEPRTTSQVQSVEAPKRPTTGSHGTY